MKLLLTSAGITNKTISNTLLELIHKPFHKTSLAFIPTAANVEEGGKEWLIDDLMNCKKLGFKLIDIVDISALPHSMWEKRLREADVIVVGGGNTFYLMYWLNKSGLSAMMKEMLKTKVYVGISAGSMVMTKNLALSQSAKMYSEEIGEKNIEKGLGFVDFHIRPHLNSPFFPKVRKEYLKEMAQKIKNPMYAIDDDTGIKVINGEITVISEGKWLKLN